MAKNLKLWPEEIGSEMTKYKNEFLAKEKMQSTNFYSDTLNEWQVNMILMKELCGTYNFKTEHKSLLRQENKFWFNLFFYGKISLYFNREEDKFVLFYPSDVKWDEFGEVEKIRGQVARTPFDFSGNLTTEVQGQGVIEFTKKDMDDIVFVKLDNTNEFFYSKYGWFSKQIVRMYNQYILSIRMKNKQAFAYINNKQQGVYDAMIESINDESTPFIEIYHPAIVGDLLKSAASLAEKPYLLEEFKKTEYNNFTIEEFIKFVKFGKDFLGMDANTSQKKERMITPEVDDAKINTQLMRNVELRNLRLAEKDILEKFGVSIEFKNSVEELEEENQKEIDKKNETEGIEYEK